MKNNYDKILAMFISNDETLTSYIQKPFTIDENVFCTDTIQFVFFNKSLLSDFENINEQLENIKQNVLKVIPLNNMYKALSLELLTEAISAVPLVDDFDIKTEEGICDACYGTGDVDFTFEHNFKDYELEGECPICEGTGKSIQKEEILNGKKVLDPEANIQILSSTFRIKYVLKLKEIAELLNEKHIYILHHLSNMGCTVFKIGEVNILLMPTFLGTAILQEKIAFKINSKMLI